MVSAIKILSQKHCQKKKTLLCLTKLMKILPEVIKRKISLGNMKIKFMVLMMIVIQTILMKIMRTNIILEKRNKYDPWQVFVAGAHRYLQDTFNYDGQHTVEKNHGH